MTNYTQSTNFATKDALTSGNPLKIVKGTEINTEFANIAIAVATKADLVSPTLITPALGTPTSGVLTNCTGLPMTTGVTGTLPVANGGTGVTTSTGSGNNVLSTSPTLVTPILGTPTSGVLTNTTGLPLTTGVTGTLPVANGGTGVTSSTGSGNNVLSTSPTLVTPVLGTPVSGTATNLTGLPLTTGVTGTLPVANGGTGVTTSTGSGDNVLSTSPTLVTPALGTPSSGTLTNCTFPTLNQNTTGSAATLTTTVNSGVVGTTQSFGTSNTTIATTAFVQAALAALHPVGSIYTATVATNPGTLLGFGTWATFGSGRMLISQDATYTAGSTGGSATTTLITANLPAHTHAKTLSDPTHNHTVPIFNSGGSTGALNGSGNNFAGLTTSSELTGVTISNGSVGSGRAATTISPYIAVYMLQSTG